MDAGLFQAAANMLTRRFVPFPPTKRSKRFFREFSDADRGVRLATIPFY